MAKVETKARSEFWTWFSTVAKQLADDVMDEELLAELDARISELGDVSWELGLGLGVGKPNLLVISPDGSPDRLPTCKEIIALAPALADWEFYPAKPAKTGWDLTFTLERSPGDEVEVDARQWRYVLYRFSDGTFDIVVETSNLVEPLDVRERAGDVVVIGLLGEEIRLTMLGEIEVVDSLDPELAPKANHIAHLAKHIARLIKRAD